MREEFHIFLTLSSKNYDTSKSTKKLCYPYFLFSSNSHLMNDFRSLCKLACVLRILEGENKLLNYRNCILTTVLNLNVGFEIHFAFSDAEFVKRYYY